MREGGGVGAGGGTRGREGGYRGGRGQGEGEGGDGHTGSLRPASRGSRTLLCDQSGHSPSCAACPCCDVTLSDDDIYIYILSLMGAWFADGTAKSAALSPPSTPTPHPPFCSYRI